MIKKDSSSGGIGAFVGFLVGVGVGVLIAAKPGHETRKQLGDMLRKGREKLGEGVQQTADSAQETVSAQGGKEPFYESGKYT